MKKAWIPSHHSIGLPIAFTVDLEDACDADAISA
jgi:hypothetical protein